MNTDKSALQSFCQSKKYASVAVRDVILNRNSQSDYPVYTLIVALNDTIERNAPIFAYQIWDELSKKGDISKLLGTHNIIFGFFGKIFWTLTFKNTKNSKLIVKIGKIL